MVDGIAVVSQAELLVDNLEPNFHLPHGSLVLLHGRTQGGFHFVQPVQVFFRKHMLALASCVPHGIGEQDALQPRLVRAVESAFERRRRGRNDASIDALRPRLVNKVALSNGSAGKVLHGGGLLHDCSFYPAHVRARGAQENDRCRTLLLENARQRLLASINTGGFIGPPAVTAALLLMIAKLGAVQRILSTPLRKRS